MANVNTLLVMTIEQLHTTTDSLPAVKPTTVVAINPERKKLSLLGTLLVAALVMHKSWEARMDLGRDPKVGLISPFQG